MWFWQLIKQFGSLFRLRTKPDAIPYSKGLLICLAIALFVTKNLSNLWFVSLVGNYDKKIVVDLSIWYSSLVIMVYLLILFATVSSILAYYKVPERTVQVNTAFLGVDLILSLLFLLWLFILSLIQLPLQGNTLLGFGLMLTFILLLYWQFMVYIHIFYNSVTISILQAGLFALTYMLVQNNVSELLLNVVIKMEPK